MLYLIEEKGIPDRVLVLGGLGGSASHTFANLNCLFKFSHLNIALISQENIAFLVNPGVTIIQSPFSSENRQVKCSLVPLGQPVRNISTKGLKWELSKLLFVCI